MDGVRNINEQGSRIDDCESIVHRWLARKLELSTSKKVLIGISNCKLNKDCPLTFPNIHHVSTNCGSEANNVTACCISVGVWAVVDVSIDADRDASNPSNFLTCRRLPSGCVVQDMPNGYSKKAMVEALEHILTPQRSIDILRDVDAAKEQGRPYFIVFVGVNGVGKSTNLAKVAYWLQQHNISVICDLVVVFL
ncbi:hypothetical protein Sjap_018379 [Stephania japonica]|uniref:SRP54-type proteins GTP-binding domain-containing protein n=1 Tax=Stephania japonica TaxID=461633 RepID=A0AAP0NL23_9MAGN